eukprot:9139310-Pyramimonas_sp.AAC.1
MRCDGGGAEGAWRRVEVSVKCRHPRASEPEWRGRGGDLSVKSRHQARLRTRLKAKNTRGIFRVCCTSFEQGRRPRAPTMNY